MNFSIPVTDSHFHLLEMHKKDLFPDDEWNKDPGLLPARGLDAGIYPQDYAERKKLLIDFPILLSSGIHPNHAEEINKADWKLLENNLLDCAAVGECGLDLFRSPDSLNLQKEILIRQIDLANAHNLPIIIHNRQAGREILDLLNNHKAENGGIFHCFSEDADFASKALDLGFYISFAGNVTYKTAENIREAAQYVPADRILTETDSPYLSPVPHRGKNNQPANAGIIAEFLSTLLNRDNEKLANDILENFDRLFTL